MRFSGLAGVALILVGAYLLFEGSFTSRRSVLDVGGVTVIAEEQRSVQPWIAGVVLLAGVALVIGQTRRKA